MFAVETVTTSDPNTMYYIGALILAGLAYFFRDRIKIPSLPSSGPSIPLPNVPVATDRPILDWMAAELLMMYGSNPITAAAIKAEVEAIKKILDAANIPSPLSSSANPSGSPPK